MQTIKTDVLIIGAGPAGTVAGALVNKAGFNVYVVEKMKFPRFVIGESLLPRCMEALEEAGLLESVLQQGFQRKTGAKFVRDGVICDYSFSDQFTDGWDHAYQVTRADFDLALANGLQAQGVPVHYETSVTAIQFREDGSSITTLVDADGQEAQVEARFIIDASGYGRVIPRLFGLERPSNLPPRKALFVHIKDENRQMDDEPDRITIVVHKPDVWVWIIPFATGITSVGFVGSPAFFEKYQGTDEEVLRALIADEPYIAKRMEGVAFLWEPKVLQSWSVTTEKFYGNGFVLTGNVTEFLDPVFSSGVTLATVSSQIAGNLVVRHLKGEKVDWEKDYTEAMMQGVNTFRSYVMSWYDTSLHTIFFAENQDPEIKRKICSVLAGYVWDTSNDYVKDHETVLHKLARTIKLRDSISYINSGFKNEEDK
ncbi:MAG TPA: NAD(P)/FAD-dependent oxidoreductase [Niabella sp.]|nr:NAD(P)/FAD-dependent oxidoreductase [Niabella sp.]HQW15550.1 NAD(P)/FAD-dependent oxidoreductase [Niabella sp.]HQX20693.1 NAD(P)/FAD-dependent oxidoreductase [Niabella sp.]HQX42502.1 NAD(P)/FAD-dependent oxidoreductase [Niabella sp.]HRB07097.1 NAD(P)/FAD-dependent oxidoreductase [Niabella sp.]